MVGHVPRNLPLSTVLSIGAMAEISHAEELIYTPNSAIALLIARTPRWPAFRSGFETSVKSAPSALGR
ncbi:MAG: hypothetical protein EXS13_04190 [Planctomycetes bacterium]|nr:hypothetical protein [Planctomycetota bacterium]